MKTYYTIALSVLAGAAIGALAVQGLRAQAKPPAYVFVEVEISNPDAYVKEFLPLATKAITTDGGGKPLVGRPASVVSIEGQPPKGRVVLVEFENIDKAKAAFTGAAYREARKIGDKYATFRIWAVEAPQ